MTGAYLKERRLGVGMSRADVAARVGLTVEELRQIEDHDLRLPVAAERFAIALPGSR